LVFLLELDDPIFLEAELFGGRSLCIAAGLEWFMELADGGWLRLSEFECAETAPVPRNSAGLAVAATLGFP
jgi:hypothetical protein